MFDDNDDIRRKMTEICVAPSPVERLRIIAIKTGHNRELIAQPSRSDGNEKEVVELLTGVEWGSLSEEIKNNDVVR